MAWTIDLQQDRFQRGAMFAFTAVAFLMLSTFAKDTATGTLDLPLAFTVHAAERSVPLAFNADVTKLPPVTVTATSSVVNPSSAATRGRVHNSFNNLSNGLASWYGSVLQNHPTASGRRFNMFELTAAHRSLPFGSKVKVTNLRTRKSVVVTITDRGVLDADRVIDLSYAAAEKLDMIRMGVDPVRLEVVSGKLGASQVLEAELR
jgi:rare lipoprotein A